MCICKCSENMAKHSEGIPMWLSLDLTINWIYTFLHLRMPIDFMVAEEKGQSGVSSFSNQMQLFCFGVHESLINCLILIRSPKTETGSSFRNAVFFSIGFLKGFSPNLFERQSYRVRWRERQWEILPSADVLPDEAEFRNLELLLGLPHWYKGPSTYIHPPLPSQVYQQRAGWEEEQPGLPFHMGSPQWLKWLATCQFLSFSLSSQIKRSFLWYRQWYSKRCQCLED